MKRKFIQFISLFLATVSLITLGGVSAFATEKNYDINGDGVTSVSDVTTLQLYLSFYETNLTDEQLKVADVNEDNKIDVDDVTALQLYLSKISPEKPKDYTNTFLLSDNVTQIDDTYKGVTYKLNSEERAFIEAIVMGEFGTSYIGSVCIAQCIRDALVNGLCKDPMKLRNNYLNGGMGYVGYNTNVTQNVKDAVSFVFDKGGSAVQHRCYVMCTSSYYYNNPGNWHSTQNFIFQYENVLFFDYWF